VVSSLLQTPTVRLVPVFNVFDADRVSRGVQQVLQIQRCATVATVEHADDLATGRNAEERCAKLIVEDEAAVV